LTNGATYVIVVATAVSPGGQLFENQACFCIFELFSVFSVARSSKLFHETAKSGALCVKTIVFNSLSAPKGSGAPVAQPGATAH
jgi:hypothetical protein